MKPDPYIPEDVGINLILRFFRILVGRKWLILGVTIVATVASMFAVVMWPSTYRSIGYVKPPRNESSSPIEAAFKEASGSLAGVLGSFLGGSESGEDDCITILNSVWFAKHIIAHFDLETVYELKGKGKPYFLADVLKRFYKNASFKVNDQGALEIAFEDKSPQRAQEIVTYMIRTLDSLYTNLQRQSTRQRLTYVDLRVSLAEADVKRLEDSLVAFQIRHNLFLPEKQVESIVENATRTELDIGGVKDELELEAALRGTSGSRYQNLQVKKRLLEKSLDRKLKSKSGSNSLVLPVHMLPALATDYWRLDRAYKVKLGLYKFLIQQAEALKLDADKNIQVVSVIDPPWVNEKRVSPKRRIVVEAVFVLSLIFTSILALLLNLWKERNKEGTETRWLLNEIRASLFRF